MKLPGPKPPPYDVTTWRTLPFPKRLELVCRAWAMQGYGTPVAVYAFYALKVAAYVAGIVLFASMSASLGSARGVVDGWWTREAFGKAMLFSMVFESLGLGCGSGPLTGRYVPPIAGFLHFARPGTTKLPLFPKAPVIGGFRRTVLDALLYVVHIGLLVRALVAPELTTSVIAPILVTLPALGLVDKTIYLASRAEHYLVVAACLAAGDDWLAGAKWVWLAIWIWAATSKINRHFPAVICVMTSNSPVLSFEWIRKRMYVGYPDDLRPSGVAKAMAAGGALVEYGFPLVLALGGGGVETTIGLVVMTGFHAYITSNVPMGVPIEWNVAMVYGGYVLFGHHASASMLAIQSPFLIGLLVLSLFVVPVFGNLFPKHVSFLSSMRYYAGNWAYSIWLFAPRALEKLDRGIVKSSPLVHDQLRRFYDENTTIATISKVIAFRAMHLHGRALRKLLPKAVDDIDRYEWLDGELVAGLALGWNFGDGHLHDERLLDALCRQCHFAPGEVRCIFVESQPMFRPRMEYRVRDAATGELERGLVEVAELERGQPWD